VLSLLDACRAGDHRTAAAICRQLSDEDRAVHCATTDPTGWTPLLYAARNGWQDVAEACLAAGQSPNSARLQSSGNGALHLAALHGHLDVARVLLAALQRHNLELQHTQEQLQSPPCSPAALKHLPSPFAASSKKQSARVTSPVPPAAAAAAAADDVAAAAGSAVSTTNLAAAATVHIAGVDVRNFNGDTPLMFAASSGHLGVAALLLNVSGPW
jgi:ankyrin repeat protein